MNRQSILLTFLVVIIFFAACENKESEEYEILNQIFPSLTDSLHVLRSNFFCKPIPSAIYNGDSVTGYDTVEYEKKIEEFNLKVNSIEKNNPKIVLAVFDSFVDPNESVKNLYNLREFEEYNSSTVDGHLGKIDLKKIRNTGDFQLHYVGELEEKYGNIQKIADCKFAGLLKLSEIYLNNHQNKAVLYCEYYYPIILASGAGFAVFLNKEERWEISKMQQIWVE